MKSILTLLFCAVSIGAQQNFDNVQVKATQLAPTIFMLTGSGGNIGVSAGPDGILIIDDQFAPLAGKIEAALKEISPGKLKFVLNTHFHGDHTGGNAHFGTNAHIIAHENTRKHLLNGPAGALPIITFDDSLHIHFNGEEIRMFHLPPGHTDGDCVIHFTKSNVIHMGDQFFSGRFPNIDLAGGGDVHGFTKNVGDMIGKIPADAKIIPGHGPLSGIEEMKKFHKMLTETTGLVEAEIAKGKTLKEIQDANVLAAYKVWEAPTLSLNRWIEIIYQSATRKKG